MMALMGADGPLGPLEIRYDNDLAESLLHQSLRTLESAPNGAKQRRLCSHRYGGRACSPEN